MLKGFLSIILLFFSVLMAATATADMAMQNPDARSAILLDGRWDTIVDPYEKGFYDEHHEESATGYFNNAKPANTGAIVQYDFARSAKLNVPGDWNTQDEKLFLYEGTIWYHRDFDIGKKTDQQYTLHFAAVNYHATVYINGKKVGTHEGGFTPFQFAINDFIKPGVNSLVVKVDNHRERDQVTTMGVDWWNYGGITRSVKVIQTPKVYIDDYSVQLSSAEPETIEGWVSVAGFDKSLAHAQAEIRIPELNLSHKISLDKNGRGDFSIPAQPQRWQPDLPKLYNVDIIYQQDLVHDKIGFRTLRVEDENIFLNEKSIFLKGISLHEESILHPGRAWSEEDARTTLSWAKELGCNFVRLTQYPHNETLVRMADKMGLLIASEIPINRTVLFNNPAVYNKAENQLTEMIARDKNRASVILWSIGSDTPKTSARVKFIGELAQKARELDNTRLITAAIAFEVDNNGAHIIDDSLAAVTDVISVNQSCGWGALGPGNCTHLKWLSRYHKPVIFSEFGAEGLQGYHGGQRWTEEYQAEVFNTNLTMINSVSFARGMAPATLKDFRSPTSPLPNVQDFWSRKGLVSERGIQKRAWHVLQDYYQNKNTEMEIAEPAN